MYGYGCRGIVPLQGLVIPPVVRCTVLEEAGISPDLTLSHLFVRKVQLGDMHLCAQVTSSCILQPHSHCSSECDIGSSSGLGHALTTISEQEAAAFILLILPLTLVHRKLYATLSLLRSY